MTGPTDDYAASLDEPIDGLRLGVAKQYLSDANDPAIGEHVRRAIEVYRSLGATIVEVDLPHTEYGVPTYYLVATAEASSNLARYDGVHYGHRAAKATDLIDLYAASRAEGFSDEVKRRIMLGTYALSSGYYDAYYLRALKARRLIKGDFDHAFGSASGESGSAGPGVDAIVCPTTPHPAWRIGEKIDDPLAMYLEDVYTVNANLAGIPGLSLPCGFAQITESTRLPIGLQLLGPAFSERRLLRVARMYEAAGDWTASQRAPLASAG
jgi:aspartyl-tRNA(Asn)/glutamyl-tRNA(Gln) amidotransferase subunit A